jgi:glyoxylate reductase
MKKMATRKPRVVLTHPLIPSVVMRELAPHALIRYAKNRKQLLTLARQADAIITLLSDPVNEELLSQAPNLKVIGNFAVGFDNIDLKICDAYGVRVVNTPNVLTRSTAELTVALIFAAARRFHEGEDLCRSGRFKSWTPTLLLGLELQGRTAVLVGEGRIGSETGRILKGIGMKVIFIHHEDSKLVVEKKLKQAQVLSLHVPLNSETHHWLDATRLKLLPLEAIVINTTRGPVVDEKALIRALRSSRIYAAGLDVYEHEPHIPKGLRNLKNVVLLPHLGSATSQAREGMTNLVIQGVLGILSGKRVGNEVHYLRPNGRKNI